MTDFLKCCFIRPRVPNDPDSASIESDDSDSAENISLNGVTYELESFNKNAMIIFCQVTSEQGSRNRDEAMKEVALLKDTFQKYRFEVEIHVDLTSSEVEGKCNEFFGRNFSEYGAVAVVILAADGKSGMLSARDQLFHESVVLKHFTSDVPETLKGKPKIYITEANRTKTSTDKHTKNHHSQGISAPIDEQYEDILGLHIPSIMEDARRSPLRIFCDRMNAPEDHGNLIGIVIGSVDEIESTFPDLQEKLELVSKFRKRFTLPMFILIE